MENTKKKSFANAYPMLYDITVIVIAIVGATLVLQGLNKYVVPKLTTAMASA